MRGGGNLGRFLLSAVVAPKVILAQRLEIFAYRDHRGAGRVDRDRCDFYAAHAGVFDGLARRRCQRLSLVVVRLRRVLRIFALPVQWILGYRRTQQAALAVDDRDAHTECAEIHAGHDRHQQPPCG